METATTQPQQPPPPTETEELNLYYVKRQAQSLYKTISNILEDLEAYTKTNTSPKWQDMLEQYSMVNIDLLILLEEVKQVSKAFVAIPKNVNAENAAIIPVMLSSKLLAEMETDDKVKREQLLQGVQSLPIPMQIESLKERIGKIAEACENAEKVLAETRKAYGFAPHRGGPCMFPTVDRVQAAKIQEQESILRAAVNEGEGIRLPPEQRQITSTPLPPHMVDALFVNDAAHLPSAANFDMGMLNAPSPQQGMGQLHGMSQGQLSQLNQFSGGASSASAKGSPCSHASQLLGHQMLSGMMQTQQSQSQQPEQQQHQQQGGYGNMQTNQQNLQP